MDPGAQPEKDNDDDKARRELLDKASKRAAHLKVTYDNVHRDLSAVGVIETKLKQKKWNTEGPLKFLKEEANKVHDVLEETLAKWVAAKETRLDTMSDQEIEAWIAEQDKHADALMTKFKNFSRDTLSEFAKMR